MRQCHYLGADPEYSERGARVLTPPPLSMKTSLFRRWSIQHCGCIRGAKWSNVSVSEDRIKEHFIKRFSGRLTGLGLVQKRFEKGGAAVPSAPPLNPPMLSVCFKRNDFSFVSFCNLILFSAIGSYCFGKKTACQFTPPTSIIILTNLAKFSSF